RPARAQGGPGRARAAVPRGGAGEGVAAGGARRDARGGAAGRRRGAGVAQPGRKGAETGGEGAPAFDLRRPDGARLAADEVPLMRALQAGEVVHGLELVAAREGEAGVPVLVSASPLPDAAGRRVGAVSVLRDISRLKEMERLREEWTAIVAHDLRQPL